MTMGIPNMANNLFQGYPCILFANLTAVHVLLETTDDIGVRRLNKAG